MSRLYNISEVVWLIPEKLAKSTVPDYSDLLVWQVKGIDSIVNLLEEKYQEVAQDEINVGFNVLHSPIPDFCAPSLDQLKKIVNWIDSEISAGRKVLVHCFAGIGRTATVLIAYLIYKRRDITSAKDQVFKTGAAPQSIEQQKILEEYYQYIKELRNLVE